MEYLICIENILLKIFIYIYKVRTVRNKIIENFNLIQNF